MATCRTARGTRRGSARPLYHPLGRRPPLDYYPLGWLVFLRVGLVGRGVAGAGRLEARRAEHLQQR